MTQPPTDDPYRHRRGWTEDSRHEAAQRFIAALKAQTELLPAAEAAAETVLAILEAESVTLSIIEGEGFRNLVNAGDLQPDMVRFPDHEIYPMSAYPAATKRLMAGRGYISTTRSLDVVREHLALAPGQRDGCFMGVPIISGGDVRGEIWSYRGPKVPAFLPEDQDLVADLATQFGTRLPRLLQRQRDLDPNW